MWYRVPVAVAAPNTASAAVAPLAVCKPTTHLFARPPPAAESFLNINHPAFPALNWEIITWGPVKEENDTHVDTLNGLAVEGLKVEKLLLIVSNVPAKVAHR